MISECFRAFFCCRSCELSQAGLCVKCRNLGAADDACLLAVYRAHLLHQQRHGDRVVDSVDSGAVQPEQPDEAAADANCEIHRGEHFLDRTLACMHTRRNNNHNAFVRHLYLMKLYVCCCCVLFGWRWNPQGLYIGNPTNILLADAVGECVLVAVRETCTTLSNFSTSVMRLRVRRAIIFGLFFAHVASHNCCSFVHLARRQIYVRNSNR